MARISFNYGTQSQFDTLTVKDSNALYFLTDSKKIYKGDSIIASDTADKVEFVSAVPTTETAEAGKIYAVTDPTSNTVALYTVQDGKVAPITTAEVAEGAIKNLDVFADGIIQTSTNTADADDKKIPTVAAVEEAITTQLADYNSAIVDVSATRSKDNTGTVIKFTAKDNTEKTVTISDLFLTAAEYDPATHKLSLTVSGVENPVEVDLSKLVPQAVSTTDVAMAANITVTTPVGNFKKGDVIDIASVTNLQELLVKMLCQDSNPTATQPSASIALTGAGAKEVGTTFTPNYSASLNPGKYVANGVTQSSGVTANAYAVTDSDSHSAATASGSFDAFTVLDTTDYYVSVSITHTDGSVPKTYLGSDYPAAQIKAGTKTASSTHVTGYRQGFYGALTSKDAVVDTTLVRSLSGKTNKKVAKKQTYTISVPAGTYRVMLAYEASVGAVSSITSAEEFGSEIKDSFTMSVVNVLDASGANGKDYNVYVKDLAGAQSTATTYTVTI